jgi:hypothetical protein
MDKKGFTVSISALQADTLRRISRHHRKEEREFVEQLVREGKDVSAARSEGARVRPVRWPSLAVLVERALERRLAEEDLAGPWPELTAEEAGRLAQSGRWPGPDSGAVLVERNYPLPEPLVVAVRTAAWRVSEEPLRQLAEEGLAGDGVVVSGRRLERREELVERIFSPSRITREALSRFGPEPPADPAPTA